MKISPDFKLQNAYNSLRVRSNLLQENQHLFKDPIRNGLLLYQILQEIHHPLNHKTPFDPVKTLEECRKNLMISLESLVKNPRNYKDFLKEIAESILKGETSFFESLVLYINSNRNPRISSQISLDFEEFLQNYPRSLSKISMNSNEIEQKSMNWLMEIGIYNVPVSWEQISSEIKGDLLFRIYEKITQEKMKPIHRFPQNEANSLANLRKFLGKLRNNKDFDQKFLWMEGEIVKGNRNIIIGLLQDIKTGFENSFYKEKKKIIGGKLESFKGRSEENETISDKFNEKIREKMHSLISERDLKYERKSKKTMGKKEKIFVFGEIEALEWIDSLGFKNLVGQLIENDEFWLEFQDGIILSQIIGKLEKTRFIINEKPKTKVACLKNIKEVLKPILMKKGLSLEKLLNFDGELIFDGKKNKIIEILLNLKNLYEEKTYKKSRENLEFSKNFFDRLLKSYVLKKKEREKMLIFPKYIDDDH